MFIIFNRAILFKVVTLLSLCGLVWLFLGEHVTNLRIREHLITFEYNNKNNNSISSISPINENTPLSSEEFNALLKEGLENFDFVSTETEDNAEESNEEIKQKEELIGKVSIQKMIKFEEGRIHQTLKKKIKPTPYQQLVTQNPIGSRRGGGRGSQKGTIDKGGLLPNLEGASKNTKELSLYMVVAGKEFTPQLVMKPIIAGDFTYFIQNEYELLIKKNMNIDSYWRAAIRTVSPLNKIQPLLPKVVVIGVMKAGTTTLHSLLGQHPQITTPTMISYFSKEAHFYDRPESYRYPESYIALWSGHSEDENKLKEEATPSYLYFPLTPFRMKSLYETPPKLIVILRDPVSRAYSHCHHAWGEVCSPAVFDGFVNEALRQIQQFEKSFDQTTSDDPFAHFILNNCKPEISSLLDREAQMFHDKFTLDHKFWAPEILLRGLYANQLKRWLKVFPREHFHIMEVADLEKDSLQKTMNQLYSWLDLDFWETHYVKSNAGGDYSSNFPMWEGTKRKLTNFFKKHDEELEKLLERKFSWMK